MKATFHERQYELAVNLELIASSGAFFAPMQIVEESVGYDIALVPGHTAVWSHLGLAPPRGVTTPLAYGSASVPVPRGPTFSASLFVQFKRPERMIRWNAREAQARLSKGGDLPFFRVRLSRGQQLVLLDLERRVSGAAIVRYAAPVFHQIEDLWSRQATRTVFEGSTFIAPSEAGSPPSCWTYDDLGSPIFCSEPRRGEPERADDILRALVRAARSEARPDRRTYLRVLASQVEEVDLFPRRGPRKIDEIDEGRRAFEPPEVEWGRPPLIRSEWVERLRAAAPNRAEFDVEAAVDAAVVSNAAGSIGLTWLLAEIQAREVSQDARETGPPPGQG